MFLDFLDFLDKYIYKVCSCKGGLRSYISIIAISHTDHESACEILLFSFTLKLTGYLSGNNTFLKICKIMSVLQT